MSYETDKRKISKLSENWIKQSDQISEVNRKNAEIDSRLFKLYPSLTVLSKAFDSTVDWTEALVRTIDVNDYNGEETPDYSNQAAGFQIELEKFDIRLLPYLKVDFLYRPLGENDLEKRLSFPNQSLFFDVADDFSDDNLKRVTINVSTNIIATFPSSSLTESWEIKILVIFVNPRLFN